jgi:hypothetical protein
MPSFLILNLIKPDGEKGLLDGIFSHVGNFICSDLDKDCFIGLSILDGLAFADLVVVEVVESKVPILDLTVDIDADAMLVQRVAPKKIKANIEIARALAKVRIT